MVISFILFKIVKKYRSKDYSVSTELKLLVFTPKSNILISLPSIHDLSQQLDFQITSDINNMYIHGIFWPKLHFKINGIIQNKFTGFKHHLPHHVSLGIYQAAKLRQILLSCFGVNLLYRTVKVDSDFKIVQITGRELSRSSNQLAIELNELVI